ncbi:MAG: hypothetical protein MUO39_11355 [Steroidobacteraceae bacterium]|nr:hypothetical protein [Steroidobacteraceae bacterium]
MEDRTARLESTVAELRQSVLSLERRLGALESRGEAATAGAGAAGQVPARDAPAKNPYDPIALLSLVGRLFLVLAGGFFLRAMTDSHVLAPPVGLSVGFAYAMVWLFFADRAGGRRQVPSAIFHALAAAMIAYPLLVEAATRFKVLGGVASALAVAGLTAAMLVVAWHRRLRVVGWITVIAAISTSAALLVQTGAVAPFACFLIALGVATMWFGYSLDWWGLRWPAALAADVAVVGVTMRVLAPEQHDTPEVAILLQFLLLGAYVGSIAIRTLIRGRNVVPFEVAQTAAALVVGFGGALYLTEVTGIVPAALGLVSLVFGAASYAVAVVFLDRRKDKGANVYYYTTLALVYVLAGFTLVVGQRWVGVVFAALAALAAALWSRFGRSFMLVHAAAYLLAAGIVSGTLGYCLRTIAASTEGPWILPSAAMVVVLVAGALSVGFAAARRNEKGDEVASGLRLVIILVFFAASSACVTGFIAPLVGGLPDGSVATGVLATVTTVVLSLATLLVAWIGRQPRFRECSWLVYPLLVAIGIKMAGQDFKHSRPATLFIAMALFGAALIIAPRLRRVAGKGVKQAGT